MAVDRISGPGETPRVESPRSNRAERTKPTVTSREEDRICLSDRKAEFAFFRALVVASPDVRSARVEALSRIIERGEYSVSSLDIANSIIQKNWNTKP